MTDKNDALILTVTSCAPMAHIVPEHTEPEPRVQSKMNSSVVDWWQRRILVKRARRHDRTYQAAIGQFTTWRSTTLTGSWMNQDVLKCWGSTKTWTTFSFMFWDVLDSPCEPSTLETYFQFSVKIKDSAIKDIQMWLGHMGRATSTDVRWRSGRENTASCFSQQEHKRLLTA